MKETIVIVAAMFLGSCSSVHFDSPMPQNQNSIKLFNTQLTGKYYYSDSVLKNENGERFYNAGHYKTKFMVEDSVALISGDLIISPQYIYYTANFATYYKMTKFDTARISEKHRKETKTMEGKYVVFKTSSTDTLLNLAGKDKLYYYHEKYYLNHYIGKKDWDVFQFEVKKDNTFSINVTNDKDADVLSDSLKKNKKLFYSVAHLSAKKFDYFIDNGGFRSKLGLIKYK